LEKAIYNLKQQKVDWKVLLLHHPLNNLREFNKQDIEDLIYTEFHLMFSGHLHKREDFVRFTLNEGIFGSYAHAAFTKKEDGKIGFSILDVQLDTLEVKINKFLYDHEEMVFLALKEMSFTFPCNEIKRDQIKIYKTLKKRYNEIFEQSNELFVSTKDPNSKNSFSDLFVDPVLRDKPDIEVGDPLTPSEKFNFQKLLEINNYMIYGKDKTGKTSLLYKLNLEILKKYTQLGQIPFYIDFAEYKSIPERLYIVRLFHNFIEHNIEATKKIIKKYNLKLLIDNFDPNHKELIFRLANFLNEYVNSSFIIIAD